MAASPQALPEVLRPSMVTSLELAKAKPNPPAVLLAAMLVRVAPSTPLRSMPVLAVPSVATSVIEKSDRMEVGELDTLMP